MLKIIMKLPAGRPALIIISILIVLGALITALLGILFLSDRSPDPALAQSVQDEYSVPVNLKIVNISGVNAAYIVPGEVRWGSGHKRLLYSLSNPKETTLAFAEILANNDADAIYHIMSQSTKDYWADIGYNTAQVLESYRSMNKNVKEPYRFDFEPGEDDTSGEMLSVILGRDSGNSRIDLMKGTDGTWKI